MPPKTIVSHSCIDPLFATRYCSWFDCRFSWRVICFIAISAFFICHRHLIRSAMLAEFHLVHNSKCWNLISVNAQQFFAMANVCAVFASYKHVNVFCFVLSWAHVIGDANNTTLNKSRFNPCNCFARSCPLSESVWLHVWIFHGVSIGWRAKNRRKPCKV